MSATTAEAVVRRQPTPPDLIRTARFTGLFYLGLAITGLLGFMIIRNQIFVADDSAATLAHLVERETLARWGIVMEVGIVFTQTLTALWFFQLFRSVRLVCGWLHRGVRPAQCGGDYGQRGCVGDCS